MPFEPVHVPAQPSFYPWLVALSMLLGALGPLIAALAAYFARKANVNSKEAKEMLNGRLDELLSLTREAAHARGWLEGNRATPGGIPPAEKAADPTAVEYRDRLPGGSNG